MRKPVCFLPAALVLACTWLTRSKEFESADSVFGIAIALGAATAAIVLFICPASSKKKKKKAKKSEPADTPETTDKKND